MRLQIIEGAGNVQFSPAVDEDELGRIKQKSFVVHRATTKTSSEGRSVGNAESTFYDREEFEMLKQSLAAEDEPLKAIQDEPEIDEEHLILVQEHLISMCRRASESDAFPVPDAPATLPRTRSSGIAVALVKRGEKQSNLGGIRSETCDTRFTRCPL